MTTTTEQGEPGAAPHPSDRLRFGYFPTPTGADPNRIDGGPVKAIAATPAVVVRVPVPPFAKVVLRVELVAVRTLPALPLVGGAASVFVAGHRDAPTNPPVVDTTTIVATDGPYAVSAVAATTGDAIDLVFTGLPAEEYSVGASVLAFGVRQ